MNALTLRRSILVQLITVFAALVLVPAVFAQSVDATLQRQLNDVRQAMLVLEGGDAEGAKKLLEPLLTQTPPNSLLRHTAALVHGQLTGSFAPRMAAWADRKVVDRVVLVPDEASLLAAVEQWPADRFWPVLIEDGWFAPLFIESFEPATVVRWDPRPRKGGDDAERVNLPGQVAAAIKQHNERFSDAKVLAKAPGLVVIDPWSPMRVAGLALAAGRGQPVMALRPEGNHSRMASHKQVRDLKASVMNALASLKLLREESWCAVTLAGDWPYKFDEEGGKYNPLCVDDYIGRDDRLIRQAVVGRLFGDATQANYMAMCSMFLQPQRGLLVNSYGYNHDERHSGFSRYHLDHAAVTLKPCFDVELSNRSDEQTAQFLRLTQPSLPFDFLWINSSQGVHSLSMSPVALVSDDMPLGRPVAVHMVASFSAADPWDATTIAGKCLAGGAYYYFGSVHEPYLESFMQSTAMAHRAVGEGTPLAFASRQPAVYPFARPWKLITLGDPLLTFRREPAERVKGEPMAGSVQVMVTEEGTAGSRLLDAALAGSESAVSLAEAAVAEPLKMPADTLAYASLTLARAGRNDLLVDLSSQAVTRHPVTELIYQRALAAEIRRHVDAGQLDEARTLVGRLMTMRMDSSRQTRLVEPWVTAMEQAGRRDEAAQWVNRFADRKKP